MVFLHCRSGRKEIPLNKNNIYIYVSITPFVFMRNASALVDQFFQNVLLSAIAQLCHIALSVFISAITIFSNDGQLRCVDNHDTSRRRNYCLVFKYTIGHTLPKAPTHRECVAYPQKMHHSERAVFLRLVRV